MQTRNKVVTKSFGMVPRGDIPRAAFRMHKFTKTTIGPDNVTPIFCEEVLPGDRWNIESEFFGRLLTPIFPILDNLWLEVFYFFVPNRIIWNHWPNMISGRNPDPTDATTYTVPYMAIHTGLTSTYCVSGTIWDHLGLPTYGQTAVGTTLATQVSALPFRAFAAIWNEWFRDPNWVGFKFNYKGPDLYGDGPDYLDSFTTDGSNTWLYPPARYKKKDYFTSSLPWPQANTTAQFIPVNSGAAVTSAGTPPTFTNAANTRANTTMLLTSGSAANTWDNAAAAATSTAYWDSPGLTVTQASLAAAMGTINQLRTAFQIQKLLERDARGGPRYTEQLQAHFGVHPQDDRMQRPEYLGSARKNLTFAQVPQTSATTADGSDTPLGELAAYAIGNLSGHIHFSAPEHGWIMGVINLTGDVSYQQGVRRHWSRSTRLDYYTPEFAMLGEQAILQKEIFCPLNNTSTDATTFGYQERWAEYRYWPDEITGLMRSAVPNTLDAWHLAQNFGTSPSNGATFMQQLTPLTRILANDSDDLYPISALKLDMLHKGVVARPLPMFSAPGLVDHF